MSFNTSKPNTKTYTKTSFMKMDLGQHIIRFLQPSDDEKEVYTHYIKSQNITFACLGDECPICQNNRKIMLENPDNFRDIPGWNPRSRKHFMNILDRTLVKVCPSCQAENKRGLNGQFAPTCSCGTFITQVEAHPSNKVKVMSFSDTVAEQINGFESSNLDAQGNKIPITNYDFMFMVTMVNTKKTITPAPMYGNTDQVDVDDSNFKANLDNATINLTPEEIVNVLKGIKLKDIFAARKVPAEAANPSAVDVLGDNISDVNVDKLFGL